MSITETPPLYDTSSSRPAALEELQALLQYKNLIYQLVRRDIVTRYKRSILGVAWTMVNPLGTMLVLTVVYSFAFGRGPDFAAYILSGLLAWNFFSQTTTAAMVNLVWGGGLLHRIYFPSTSFAIAAIGTGLVNLGLSLIPMFIVMIVTGRPIRLSVFFLPISMIHLAFFSLGVGLFISAMAVYYPDVKEMYLIVLTAWMYLSPIIYPEEILPPLAQEWLPRLNPIYPLIKIFRLPLYDGRLPTFAELWPATIGALIAFVIGWYFFTKRADEFAYRV